MSEQTTAFRPFPGEFIILALIARRTCQHQIIDTVRGDITPCYTPQREGMIDVIDILPTALLKPGMTARRIIAAILLAFQQILDLCSSIGTRNSLFASTPLLGRSP